MKKGIILGITFILTFSLIDFLVEITFPNSSNQNLIAISFYVLAGILIKYVQKTFFPTEVEG